MQKKYLTPSEAKTVGHGFVDIEAKKLQSRLIEKREKSEMYA